MECAKGKWVDELPVGLWPYRTTKMRSTSKTPFCLAYKIKVIIPSLITIPSMRHEVGNLDRNCKQMKVNFNLVEEEREKAIVRVAAYQ